MTDTPTEPDPSLIYQPTSLIKLYEPKPPTVKAVLFDGSNASEAAVIDLLEPYGAWLMVNLTRNERYVQVGENRLIHKNITAGMYVLVTMSATSFPEAQVKTAEEFDSLYRPAL
jgi:hypothetical protein